MDSRNAIALMRAADRRGDLDAVAKIVEETPCACASAYERVSPDAKRVIRSVIDARILEETERKVAALTPGTPEYERAKEAQRKREERAKKVQHAE